MAREKKTLVVHCHATHRTAGLFQGDKLTEIYIEEEGEDRGLVGSIYLGKVVKVVPSMQACFVDIGIERDGFLSADDAVFGERADRTESRRVEHLVQRGDMVLVQITKEPVADKGVRVSTDLSLPGRYLVLRPLEPGRGCSRKIDDNPERDRLLALAELYVPPEYGIIIRTVAEGISKREFRADFKYLLNLWQGIVKERRRRAETPGLLHQDLDLVQRALRDNYAAGEFDRVIVDDRAEQKRILKFLKSISPRGQWDRKVVAYNDTPALDVDFGLHREIARCLERKVWLPCGGYLIIEEMETLTAIDVNSGKNIRGDKQNEIILQTNLEAAEEVPRQLRLRGLGGIIVIDFIDMDNKGDRKKVIAALRAALKSDKAASDIYSYPDVGLVHLTRQRTQSSLSRQLTAECPTCRGNGCIPKGLLLHG